MVKTWKNILSIRTILEILLGVTLLVIILMYHHGCGIPQVVTKPILQPTVTKIDKKGTEYIEVKGNLYTQEQVDCISDSFKKVLKNIDKVKGVIVTTTKGLDTQFIPQYIYTDTGKGTIVAQDSNKNYKIEFAGNYKENTGKFSLKIVPDTGTYILGVKKRFFRPDSLLVNIYHTNDLFKPVLGSAYLRLDPKVIAVIGPMVGAGYSTDGKLVFVAGIALTMNIIPIKRKK